MHTVPCAFTHTDSTGTISVKFIITPARPSRPPLPASQNTPSHQRTVRSWLRSATNDWNRPSSSVSAPEEEDSLEPPPGPSPPPVALSLRFSCMIRISAWRSWRLTRGSRSMQIWLLGSFDFARWYFLSAALRPRVNELRPELFRCKQNGERRQVAM